MTPEEGQLLVDIMINQTLTVYVIFLGIGFTLRILSEIGKF